MKIQMRHAVVSLLVAAMSASLPAMSKQSVSVVNNQEKTVLSTEKESQLCHWFGHCAIACVRADCSRH